MVDWTDSDQEQAVLEDWYIGNHPELGYVIDICSSQTFKSVYDAHRFVWDKACKEDRLAAKAIAFLYYNAPKEFDAIFLSTLYILPE